MTTTKAWGRRWLSAYPLALAFAVGVIVTSLLLPLSSGPETAQLSTLPGSTPGTGSTGGPDALPLPSQTAATLPSAPSGGTSGGAGTSGTGGSAGSGGGSSTGTAIGTGSGGLTSTDRGVTASTIKIGVPILDADKVAVLGLAPPGFTTQGQRDYTNAQLDVINRAGGINGRKVVPFFATIDPTNGASEGTACQQFTEDQKVFAVVGGLGPDGVRCVTQQHKTPMFLSGTSSGAYAASGGLVATASPTLTRGYTAWAYALGKLGHLKGKTVGILSDAAIDADVNAALIPSLKALGHTSFVYSLSSDIQTASSQIPIAVQQMKAHNVDALLIPTAFLYLVQFTREAEHQLYTPQYHVSDANGLTIKSLVEQTGDSFDGAIGITYLRSADAASGVPEQPVARSCRETYNRYAKASLTYAQSDPYFQTCENIAVFARAAALAGVNLTRPGYAQAVQQIPSIELANLYGGSFRPGKRDFADLLRPIVYHKSCKCYRNTGSVMRGQD